MYRTSLALLMALLTTGTGCNPMGVAVSISSHKAGSADTRVNITIDVRGQAAVTHILSLSAATANLTARYRNRTATLKDMSYRTYVGERSRVVARLTGDSSSSNRGIDSLRGRMGDYVYRKSNGSVTFTRSHVTSENSQYESYDRLANFGGKTLKYTVRVGVFFEEAAVQALMKDYQSETNPAAVMYAEAMYLVNMLQCTMDTIDAKTFYFEVKVKLTHCLSFKFESNQEADFLTTWLDNVTNSQSKHVDYAVFITADNTHSGYSFKSGDICSPQKIRTLTKYEGNYWKEVSDTLLESLGGNKCHVSFSGHVDECRAQRVLKYLTGVTDHWPRNCILDDLPAAEETLPFDCSATTGCTELVSESGGAECFRYPQVYNVCCAYCIPQVKALPGNAASTLLYDKNNRPVYKGGVLSMWTEVSCYSCGAYPGGLVEECSQLALFQRRTKVCLGTCWTYLIPKGGVTYYVRGCAPDSLRAVEECDSSTTPANWRLLADSTTVKVNCCYGNRCNLDEKMADNDVTDREKEEDESKDDVGTNTDVRFYFLMCVALLVVGFVYGNVKPLKPDYNSVEVTPNSPAGKGAADGGAPGGGTGGSSSKRKKNQLEEIANMLYAVQPNTIEMGNEVQAALELQRENLRVRALKQQKEKEKELSSRPSLASSKKTEGLSNEDYSSPKYVADDTGSNAGDYKKSEQYAENGYMEYTNK